MPEDKGCSKEDLNSTWGEEKKSAEHNKSQPGTESHSSVHMESDDLVNSETLDGTDCQQGEHILPHIGMKAKSQTASQNLCSSTTDSHGEPVEDSKKRGRTCKIKPLLTEKKRDTKLAGNDAVQHKEISTTILSPKCLENHNNNVPNISHSAHNEMPAPHPLSDCKVEDSVPMLPKRKRGRPKKTEIIPCFPAPSAGINISGRIQRLRSRGEQPLTQDGKTDSDSKVDPKQTEIILSENSTTLTLHGIKRRRATLISQTVTDQQVPAKVSKVDLSQEAMPLLSNETDSGARSETDEQVELNTDKQMTDTEKMTDHILLHCEDGPKQHTEEKEGALIQRKLNSQPAVEPKVTPLVELNCLNLECPTQSDDPDIIQSADKSDSEEAKSKNSLESQKNAVLQNTKPLTTDFVTSSGQPAQPDGVLPAIRTENVEKGLDLVNPVIEPYRHTLSPHYSNSAVKSVGSESQQNAFRRKRGGKRRRRVRSTLLPTAHFVKGPEDSGGTKQKMDYTDGEKGVFSNDKVIYIKKGGKTLLKCSYCGQTFKFLSQLVIHQRVHTGERPFKCLECGKGFSKNSNLNLHLKTHKKNNIYQKCPICKIKFSCSEYSSHMKMHEQGLDKDPEDNRSEKRHKRNEHQNCPAIPSPEPPEQKETKVCQYCGKTFRFPSALIRHVRVHTGEKPYKCDICGKAFGQAYFLRVHELTHWSVKRYNCTRCEKSFTHYSNAKNHACRPVGSDSDLKPNRRLRPSLTYTCHICKNVCDSVQDFNSHMKDHSGTKLYRCTYCDKLFGVISEFSSHCSQCRGGKTTSSCTIKEEKTMSLIPYTLPTPVCSSGQDSASPAAAANSVLQRKSETSRKKRFAYFKKPFQLTVIPHHPLSHFVSKLNQLDKCSDPRKYLCPSCGRLFRHMGRLRAHMLTHKPGQSYTCTCCGKTLDNWKKLWHHQRIHRQRRGRFTCPQCGQGFRFVQPYKKHMRSEHPEFQWIPVRPKKAFLPYQCEQCTSSFKTLDMLFSHQLCHSSAQDMHKDINFELSIDDHATQSIKKMLHPLTKNHVATLHPEQNNSPSSPLCKYPDSVPQESPLDLSKSLPNRSSTRLTQDLETSLDSRDVNLLGKSSTPLKTVKKPNIHDARISNGESSDGVKCAICGDTYPAISDLYQHYLQHARGEVL